MCGMNHIWMCTARSRSVRMIPLFQSAKQKLCMCTVYIYIRTSYGKLTLFNLASLPQNIDCTWFGKVAIKCYINLLWVYTSATTTCSMISCDSTWRTPEVAGQVTTFARWWSDQHTCGCTWKRRVARSPWNCNGLKHQLKDFGGTLVGSKLSKPK